MIYRKSVFGNIDFSLTRDPEQKSAILERSSLPKIAANLECLPKVLFLTRRPSNKVSSIFDSTLKFLRGPTTEPGLFCLSDSALWDYYILTALWDYYIPVLLTLQVSVLIFHVWSQWFKIYLPLSAKNIAKFYLYFLWSYIKERKNSFSPIFTLRIRQ